jgi:hypothetical protein
VFTPAVSPGAAVPVVDLVLVSPSKVVPTEGCGLSAVPSCFPSPVEQPIKISSAATPAIIVFLDPDMLLIFEFGSFLTCGYHLERYMPTWSHKAVFANIPWTSIDGMIA